MRIALFPGSFDPVTNGHLDVISRAAKLFDELLVSVAVNESKHSMFTMKEREKLLEQSCADTGLKNVRICSFDGLLVNAVRDFNANVVIRGLRAVSDFEFEFQMAMMNRELDSICETIFMMPCPEYSFISSRMIKEIARLGGDISAFVPAHVVKALKYKYKVLSTNS